MSPKSRSGTKVASFAYGPYGEPLTSAGAPSWAGARYRYTGQIVIAGAQTYFYKARMYDPSTGRFFQTDPAGFGGGVNIYAYAMNDPINGWDPTGTDYWSPGGYYCSSDIGSLDYGIDDGYGNLGYMNGSVGNCEGYSGGGEFGQSSVGGPFGGGPSSGAERGDGGKPQAKGATSVGEITVVAPKRTQIGCPRSGSAGGITNTIGGVFAASAYLAGTAFGTNPHLSLSPNAIRVTGSPINIGGRAVTIGNFEIFTPQQTPGQYQASYTAANVNTGQHENGHSYQATVLGDLYLPLEATLAFAYGNNNPMETQADEYALSGCG